MANDDDAVAAAIDRYLAYLEEGGDAPAFEELPTDARREVDELVAGLHAARGIDPYASRPSVEALVAGSEFEDMFREPAPIDQSRALDEVRSLLAAIETPCRVELSVDEEGHGLVVRRRDLIMFLFIYPGPWPVMTAETRRRAIGVFAKPNIERVCIVASEGPDHPTQTLSAADLGLRYASPAGSRNESLPEVLPVEVAIKRLLETCAPEWDPVDFSPSVLDSTPTAEVAEPIVHDVVSREASRAYRGDKARAYRGLVGRESAIVEVVSQVSTGPTSDAFDAAVAIALILGEAA